MNVHTDLEPEGMVARSQDTAARGEPAVEAPGLSKSSGSGCVWDDRLGRRAPARDG